MLGVDAIKTVDEVYTMATSKIMTELTEKSAIRAENQRIGMPVDKRGKETGEHIFANETVKIIDVFANFYQPARVSQRLIVKAVVGFMGDDDIWFGSGKNPNYIGVNLLCTTSVIIGEKEEERAGIIPTEQPVHHPSRKVKRLC